MIVPANLFEITIEDTASDIAALINSKVNQFASRRSLDDQTKQKLATSLLDRAKGTFLWVVLVLKELERRDERLTDELIASRLEKAPTTRVTTYEAILKTPPASRQSDLWRIIRWLMNARRVLAVSELERALCLELGIFTMAFFCRGSQLSVWFTSPDRAWNLHLHSSDSP